MNQAASAQHNLPAVSVSEISGALKRMIEDQFGYVRVRGEVSGWKGPHSSGHGYFRLKDDKAVLEAVCWRGTMGKLGCKLEEGLEIICTGRITTYPGRSNYQLVVESAEPAGVGALMALLEKRRAQFEAEGLFKAERKKPLPFLPQVIGVVTSPTGAVIRDILHRISDRFPMHVLVWPVAVQGETAAAQVAAAIAGFNSLAPGGAIPRPDVLIVARGGGSIEDLWPFNEEVVVRAAAASAIPLISAVGHETDTTLIDFVADRRAPTPTAAAEMAVPVCAELTAASADLAHRLRMALHAFLQRRGEHLQLLARALPNPLRMIEHAQQRLDDWTERLHAALPQCLGQKRHQLEIALAKLSPRLLQGEIAMCEQRLIPVEDRLKRAMQRQIEQREQKLELLTGMLAQLDYRKILSRGFALVRDASGRLVASAAQARQQAELTIDFADGSVKVKP